jgi:dTDP-N-acetylfucosamine:lipid II N-acetylfucosaminyltransferase
MYNGELFDNQIIILDYQSKYNAAYRDRALFFSPEQSSINEVVEVVNSYDILVVYDLDFLKAQVITQIDPTVKVIWRFFGHELYARKPYHYLDKTSQLLMFPKIVKEYFKTSLSSLFAKERVFRQAISRIDLMAGLFVEEYTDLQNIWPTLPEFIPIPFQKMASSILTDSSLDKKNIVVVGNSRSFFNNHLDVLRIVKNTNMDPGIRFKILFNYGRENAYTSFVRKKTKNLQNVELIESFIPLEDFHQFYYPVSSMVNNSHRQLALGNIFLCLKSGVKIYLNERSPTLTWLKNLGFRVFNMSEFKLDLSKNNLLLTSNEQKFNLDKYELIMANYTNEEFQHNVIKKLFG